MQKHWNIYVKQNMFTIVTKIYHIFWLVWPINTAYPVTFINQYCPTLAVNQGWQFKSPTWISNSTGLS